MAAEQGSALDAMVGNPAGLSAVRTRVLELSGLASLGSGSFQNSVDSRGTLRGASGALPYGSFAAPLGHSRWSAALALAPEMITRVDWHFIDPPGTAGVSYGRETDKSKIVAFRSSAGIAAALGSHWSAGATFGLIYNTNTLNAPYIFQQQPRLVGWDGSAGAQWQPSTRLQLGAAWKSGARVQSHGDANGSASALFAALGIAADPAFHYQAEVDNHLPQSVAAGIGWQQNHHMHWVFEGNWTDWGGAFQALPVKLKEGTNPVINSVVGADALRDSIPLHWRDQGALHAGLELPVRERWTLRGGYTYMSDPVPSGTLTPMTAAILRNTLAAGGGLARGKWQYDLAYQVQLPALQRVGQSSLLAGEFNNSRVTVMAQSLILTTRVSF